jgi:hypothetical protein
MADSWVCSRDGRSHYNCNVMFPRPPKQQYYDHNYGCGPTQDMIDSNETLILLAAGNHYELDMRNLLLEKQC